MIPVFQQEFQLSPVRTVCDADAIVHGAMTLMSRDTVSVQECGCVGCKQ